MTKYLSLSLSTSKETFRNQARGKSKHETKATSFYPGIDEVTAMLAN